MPASAITGPRKLCPERNAEVPTLQNARQGSAVPPTFERTLAVSVLATWGDAFNALLSLAFTEVGSCQAEWAMLHRLRAVLVRPRRDRLAGVVEVDGTWRRWSGSGDARRSCWRQEGPRGIAVEIRESRGVGRCRMLPLADAAAASLNPLVKDHVEPGTRVITDGWKGYRWPMASRGGIERVAPLSKAFQVARRTRFEPARPMCRRARRGAPSHEGPRVRKVVLPDGKPVGTTVASAVCRRTCSTDGGCDGRCWTRLPGWPDFLETRGRADLDDRDLRDRIRLAGARTLLRDKAPLLLLVARHRRLHEELRGTFVAA